MNQRYEQSRRHFLGVGGIGLGSIAFGSLANGLPPDIPGRAKRVIHLFMGGGPSQFELLAHKPKLNQLHGVDMPASYLAGQRFAFMDSTFSGKPKILGFREQFHRCGQAGLEFSNRLPFMGALADEFCLVQTIKTEVFNHGPAKLFMNTGSAQYGRPSMGSWISYGLGQESMDLPGYVILQSGARPPHNAPSIWNNGFLSSKHQGVPFRSGDAVLYLNPESEISERHQRAVVEAVYELGRLEYDREKDPEILARIDAYRMAYRMQSSVPDLFDLRKESAATLNLYGANPQIPSFARNCLMARRLAQRGVRFIQLYHTDWDHHGGPGKDLQVDLPHICRQVDQAVAALIRDLKSQGMLEDTLVVWGGEFGRTPMGEQRITTGRNHHVEAFPMLLAGGGITPGMVYGETDEFGFQATRDPVHVRDLHATILHLLGLNANELTVPFRGRDMRLTDIGGDVIRNICRG